MATTRPHLVTVPDGDPDIHQRDAINHHINTAVEQIEKHLRAIELLRSNPSGDAAHDYLEAVRLTAEARDAAGRACVNIAAAAHRAPARLSLARLAGMMHTSVNTLRKRFTEAAQPPDEPFTAF